jgi:hypothetical protein
MIYLNLATVQEIAMYVLWFFETKPVIKMQRRYRTQYGKDPPTDKAIRRGLKQFQETGCVLHRKGAGRPSSSLEGVDGIQEAFSRSPQKSTRRVFLQLYIPQTIFGALFILRRKHFELHFHIMLTILFCFLRFENYGPQKPRQ